MQYNTKNKKAVMEFFQKNNDEWFTAEQIAEKIYGIARSSVYRLLGELCDGKLLLREYSEKNGCTVYKMNVISCHGHFHLRCLDCGKYVHIEDKKTEELISAIAEKNEFSIDKGKTILYGKCEECRKRGNDEK